MKPVPEKVLTTIRAVPWITFFRAVVEVMPTSQFVFAIRAVIQSTYGLGINTFIVSMETTAVTLIFLCGAGVECQP
jgi:hypothetical protein